MEDDEGAFQMKIHFEILLLEEGVAGVVYGDLFDPKMNTMMAVQEQDDEEETKNAKFVAH